MKHYLTSLAEAIQNGWEQKALCNFQGEAFTNQELATQIAKFHLLFEQTGIKKGDRISVCAKNSARWAVSFLSINTYEAVVVPILADFLPDNINTLVDHSESVVLFTDTDMWHKLDPEKMPNIKYVVSVSDFSLLYNRDERSEQVMNNLESLFAQKYPNGFSKEDVHYSTDNEKDLAIINYTSGTTSAPKGVMLKFESISANVEFAQRRLPADSSDSLVSMLPMAHMYGMMFEFLYPLCCNVCIYYLGKTPTPQLLLAALREVKPYMIITVPLVMEKIFKSSVLPTISKPAMKVLLAIPGVSKLLLNVIKNKLLTAFGGNIRTIIMGGAALSPEVEKWFRKMGLPYTVGYGMTEACPLLAFENWERFAFHSCGKAIDCCEVRINSEDPQNVVGEIQARGMNVMIGYYKNPEATAAALSEDGWLNTGDLGVIDADGNIFIRGRSKNMILTSDGQNIYPEDIEEVLNNQPYMVESVVVGRGNTIVAMVYFDPNKLQADGLDKLAVERLAEEMKVNVNKQLPVYSKLAKIEIMDEPFQKTPKMSIKRALYK